MEFTTITGFDSFCEQLEKAGFCLGGDNPHGVFTLNSHFSKEIEFHTGDPEHDPWIWRMRAVTQRGDIAYAKLFFHLGGYLTREWYPYFLAVRRGGRNLEEEYREGNVKRMELDLYRAVCEHGRLPLFTLKALLGVNKDNAHSFESAAVSLQEKMYLTICGEQRKTSKSGEPYGWPVTVLCPVEDFFGAGLIQKAAQIRPQEAYEKIAEQVYRLNPAVEEKTLRSFIRG